MNLDLLGSRRGTSPSAYVEGESNVFLRNIQARVFQMVARQWSSNTTDLVTSQQGNEKERVTPEVSPGGRALESRGATCNSMS